MKYFDFADIYFDKNKDKFDSLKKLEEKRQTKLFDKLLRDQNEINFLSWLSEMNFGLRLDKFASTMSYDKPTNNQTPDWIVSANDQTIIFEVLRINLDENALIEKINNFKESSLKDQSSIAAMTFSKRMDGEYFYGAQDKIVKKEATYRELIKTGKYPFIICVDCSEIKLFTFYNDFWDFFIADGRHGYFFRNEDFGQNVTGLFVLVPLEGYKYIENPRSKNKLNQVNYANILSICD